MRLLCVCSVGADWTCSDLHKLCRPACWALMETKRTGHSVSAVSSCCPPLSLYCASIWLWKRTVPSLSLTANYFWPTYPDRRVGEVFFFPFSFSIFSWCCCFFLLFMLHCLFFFCFCLPKKINWKGRWKGSSELAQILLTACDLRLSVCVFRCMCVRAY